MQCGRQKTAFTLVELLVVIAIIAILAGMLLGLAATAMGTARVARTEALIARLHTVFSQHYDTLRYQRVEVNENDTNGNGVPNYIETLDGATAYSIAGQTAGQALATARLAATREQLKLQLPDRWSDLLGMPLGADGATPPAANTAAAPRYLATLPPITLQYLRRYDRIRTLTNTVTETANTAKDLRMHQGAECLYMIVMMAAGDGESAGLFKESDIGDADGDGAPEFIDAWGNPIEFLRWAPGFESDIQPNVPDIARLYKETDGTADQKQAAVLAYVAANRDPYDLFRMDRMTSYNPASDAPRGFRLAPLIYSAGPDREYGIATGPAWVDVESDPYRAITDDHDLDDDTPTTTEFRGAFVNRGQATDNITNHYFEGR